MNHTEACRACGETKFSPWGNRDGQQLIQCNNCDLVFFSPYPTEKQLSDFYNATYHRERGYSEDTDAGVKRAQMYALDISDLNATLPNKGDFLDVGCAEGAFLSHLNSTWRKFGTDVSTKALERAAKIPGVKTFPNIDDIPNESFDVVHLRGVFEHLLYPNKEIARLAKKLRPGGTLVLSNTPNVGGIVPKIFRGDFKLVLPNEHVNYFSPKTIEILFQKNGLRVERIKYPYFGSPYARPVRDFFSIATNYILGKQSPPFYGNIFTIYGKRVQERRSS